MSARLNALVDEVVAATPPPPRPGAFPTEIAVLAAHIVLKRKASLDELEALVLGGEPIDAKNRARLEELQARDEAWQLALNDAYATISLQVVAVRRLAASIVPGAVHALLRIKV